MEAMCWSALNDASAWNAKARVVPLRGKKVNLPDPLNRFTARRLTHDGLAKLCQDIGGRCGAEVNYGQAKDAAKQVFGRL